jgi:hypothetical protein
MRLIRPAPLLAAIGLAPCLTLGACGTDVTWLVKRNSELVIEADRIAAVAETVDRNLTTPMYDAEDAKRAACQTIYDSISAEMTRSPSFGEALLADLGLFVAYFLPIDEIERCARAESAYRAAVEALQRRLQGTTAKSDQSGAGGN